MNMYSWSVTKNRPLTHMLNILTGDCSDLDCAISNALDFLKSNI